MKRARNDYNFVDLEARVGSSDEDKDEVEVEEGETFFVGVESTEHQYTPWSDFADLAKNSNQGGWSNLVSSLEERFASGSENTNGTTEGHGNHMDDYLAHYPALAAAIENITRLPTQDDYPLWRVRCKAGLEEGIVFFLLQMAYPRYDIRSAFAHGSARGWVYVEATMNDHLRRLLRLTPGVLCNRHGICCEHIPLNEGLELLKMRPLKAPELGEWVQVRRGTYKGDVGYVLSVRSSEVDLLLIPRLTPDASRSKRKCSQPRVPPQLFNHATKNVYSARFEHGLLVRSYSVDAVSTGISTIPLESFTLFRASGHPRLLESKSAFPRPSEWHFLEGEEVYNTDEQISTLFEPVLYKSGFISKIRDDAVELDTKEGIVVVPWMAICKVLDIGQFVEVTGGLHKEQKGWVGDLELGNKVANVIRMVDEKPTSGHAEEFQVPINLLKRSDVPFVLAWHPERSSAVPRPEQVPWIKLDIVIAHGPMKGYPGVIKDILCNQPTPSGLQVVVQITSLDPSAPFKNITLDYDHVLEASRGVKLHHFVCPKAEIFMPRNYKPPTIPSPMVIPQRHIITSGNTTPFPESCLSSSPAWDPSSRTPQPPSQSVDPEVPPNSHTSLASPSRPIDPDHVLLDPRLVNVGLKVIVNGGEYQKTELNALIVSMEGRLSICRRKYKTLEYLSPEWVTPKYPNPKRENGLLIVIKGEHFGKYARRIYHRFVGDPEEAIAILAVVNRVPGRVPDTLSGDQLEVDASHLCVCEESIEDRKQNDLVMETLRTEARKKRAK